MSSKARFKVENPIVFIFAIFYVVAGAAEIFVLAIANFAPHLAILGLLSLIAAYGLFRMKRWSVMLVTALFFLGLAFGATTLYSSIALQTFGGALLFHSALVVYLILTVVTFVYVAARRKDFE